MKSKPKIIYGVKEVLTKDETPLSQTSEIVEDYIFSIMQKKYSEYLLVDKERLALLEEKVKDIEERLEQIESSSKVQIVVTEEMDLEAVKSKVLNYIDKHKIFDIEQLHKNIKCDILLLIKILDDLKQEGEISEA